MPITICRMMGSADTLPRCNLCGRSGVRTTRHHLIPRMRHRNKRVRRTHAVDRLRETVDLCRPCHRHVHATLTEKELADAYNTLHALRRHPEIAKFINWVRTKPAHLRVRSRSAG